jgi:hypothetical protein
MTHQQLLYPMIVLCPCHRLPPYGQALEVFRLSETKVINESSNHKFGAYACSGEQDEDAQAEGCDDRQQRQRQQRRQYNTR